MLRAFWSSPSLKHSSHALEYKFNIYASPKYTCMAEFQNQQYKFVKHYYTANSIQSTVGCEMLM